MPLKEIRSEIQICAPIQKVWSVLVDFHRYGEWNPFIYAISGEAKEDSKIRISIRTPSGKTRNYEPVIMSVKEGHELRWVGKSLLLQGEHVFMLESINAETTRFLQFEIFHGMLSSFFGKGSENDIAEGFALMNKALKRKAESN